ncbi:MAG: glycine cleavage system protein GcvH [Bacteroidetes bacterium]|jgi:glycine cleavage system H protein|nr:glycine cleavage system protein GcvH [Bacteroidota bacterium]
MNVPENLKYTKDHEWIRVEGGFGWVGITEFAQGELGDIVFVELPAVGTKVEQGKTFGTIEAVKAVSELYAPITGEIVEVNKAVQDQPESVNKDPYNNGWMVKIAIANPAEVSALLDAPAYKSLIGK